MDPNNPETQDICRIAPPEEKAKEDFSIKAESTTGIDYLDENAAEDLDIEITANNIDPLCEFKNSTRHHSDNLWKSKEAELAFENWFE